MNNNSYVFDTNVLLKRLCAIDCRLIQEKGQRLVG
jgi:hypothetical protein